MERSETSEISEKRKMNPHIAAKIAAVEIYENVSAILYDGKKTHAASVFAALGSLAGHACLQEALLAQQNSGDVLITVSDVAGRFYYYGEPVDRPLLQDRLSVWALLHAAMQKYQDAAMPDTAAIARHVTQTIGTAHFGIPRLPLGEKLHLSPLESLQLWQPLKAGVLDRLHVPVADWHLAYALAIQKMLAQEMLPPSHAALIVMECAVPMSKTADV